MATANINVRTPQPSQQQVRNKPMYGYAKDKIWIADDFNEPLDDFKEYM